RERAAAPRLSALDTVLRATIEEELTRNRGNKLAAARALNISRTTLYKRIRDFGISS
ncbi:transcriptional regulator, partial [Mycobacterium sp. ITM-2017-0098]